MDGPEIENAKTERSLVLTIEKKIIEALGFIFA